MKPLQKLKHKEAAKLLDPERFMTLQFERGYSSRDILLHKESNEWYGKLLLNSDQLAEMAGTKPWWPKWPNKFWARQVDAAKKGRDMNRMTAMMQGLGR